MEIIIILAIWVGFGLLGANVLEKRGFPRRVGLYIGAPLGPIGIIVVLLFSLFAGLFRRE